MPNGLRDIITIMFYAPTSLDATPACAASPADNDADATDSPSWGSPPEEFKLPNKRKVRAMEYDMREFFESRVQVYAQLTDTGPAARPHVGAPYGSELTRRRWTGRPPGRNHRRAIEALADLLHVKAKVGPPTRRSLPRARLSTTRPPTLLHRQNRGTSPLRLRF